VISSSSLGPPSESRSLNMGGESPTGPTRVSPKIGTMERRARGAPRRSVRRSWPIAPGRDVGVLDGFDSRSGDATKRQAQAPRFSSAGTTPQTNLESLAMRGSDSGAALAATAGERRVLRRGPSFFSMKALARGAARSRATFPPERPQRKGTNTSSLGPRCRETSGARSSTIGSSSPQGPRQHETRTR